MKKLVTITTLLLTLTSASLLAQSADSNSTPDQPITDSLESSNSAILSIPLVSVGDAGNAADPDTKLGAVAQTYQIGKYETTAGQYALFLNAVASTGDPHGLYDTRMGTDKKVASITRATNTNSDGTISYTYNVISGREMLPIAYVSLYSAERFCNWLENGAPTPLTDEAAAGLLESNISAKKQALLANYISSEESTESGAYNFSTDENGEQVVDVNPSSCYHIPSQDEWVKAAYYKGNGISAGYWMYPTASDTAPNSGLGDITDSANYQTYRGRLPSNFLSPDLMITAVDCFSSLASSNQVSDTSFYGACDMAGNVAEWTMASLSSSNTNTNVSSLIVARGGSWKSSYSWYSNNDLMRTAPPKGYNPSEGTDFIGFRVAYSNNNNSAVDFSTSDSWTPAQWEAAESQFNTSLTLLVTLSLYEIAKNCWGGMPFADAAGKFLNARMLINIWGLFYNGKLAGDDLATAIPETSRHGKFMPKRFLMPALTGAKISLEGWGMTSGIEIAGNTLWYGKLQKYLGFATKAGAEDVAKDSLKVAAEDAVGLAILATPTGDAALLTEGAIEGAIEVAPLVEQGVSGAWTLGQTAETYIGNTLERLVGTDLRRGAITALDNYTRPRIEVNVGVVLATAIIQGVKASGLPSLYQVEHFPVEVYNWLKGEML